VTKKKTQNIYILTILSVFAKTNKRDELSLMKDFLSAAAYVCCEMPHTQLVQNGNVDLTVQSSSRKSV